MKCFSHESSYLNIEQPKPREKFTTSSMDGFQKPDRAKDANSVLVLEREQLVDDEPLESYRSFENEDGGRRTDGDSWTFPDLHT